MTYHIGLDIETTSLHADDGIIVCYAIVGQEGITYSNIIKAPEEEAGLLRRLIADLCDLRVRHLDSKILSYYGYSFDYPMIITRLYDWKMYDEIRRFRQNFVGRDKHIDLYYVVRSNLLLKSRKLEDVCAYLGIPYQKPCESGKWVIEQWMAGNYDAVQDYCIQDAKILHVLHEKLIETNLMER
ncbi:MAG: ribonuclease H-like domain-containing protein [Methanocellales archaeon]|nr:ribonuclease H-like domain-containing protein [Methanocellales archaeon]